MAKTSGPKIENEHLSRDLKNRHVQMIAIGGAIGVGLFYGSAGAIHSAGPSIILAYLAVGVAIYIIMRALGEMAVEEPVSGSYVSYGSRYISPFVGFFLGWNIILTLAAGAAAEYNAIGQYVQFWIPDFPIWITSLIVLGIILLSNLVSVKAYGETEFWLSIIKVAAIIGMIILGGAMIIFGLGNGGHAIGFDNLTKNGGFFPMGAKGWMLSLVLVAFAFGGVETVGVTAGEAKDVKKTIPKAINGVFWRILIFYVGAITVMVALFDWQSIGTNGSPFVTVFSKIGIPGAASIINLVVITAGISSMNSGIYAITRYLYNLSLQGNVPAVFSKLNKNNVPSYGIIVCVIIQIVGILINFIMPESAFSVFSSIVVIGLVAGWLTILFSQLKFRKIRMENGTADQIAYKMPFFPYSSYFAIAFMLFIITLMWLLPFTRVGLYVCPVEIIILYIFYKIMAKRKKAAQ